MRKRAGQSPYKANCCFLTVLPLAIACDRSAKTLKLIHRRFVYCVVWTKEEFPAYDTEGWVYENSSKVCRERWTDPPLYWPFSRMSVFQISTQLWKRKKKKATPITLPTGHLNVRDKGKFGQEMSLLWAMTVSDSRRHRSPRCLHHDFPERDYGDDRFHSKTPRQLFT